MVVCNQIAAFHQHEEPLSHVSQNLDTGKSQQLAKVIAAEFPHSKIREAALDKIFKYIQSEICEALCVFCSGDSTMQQIIVSRAGPSLRRVRQLPKAPKWKGAPKFQKRTGEQREKKKNSFKRITKIIWHILLSFNPKKNW